MPPYKKFYILPGTIARTYVSLNSKNNIIYLPDKHKENRELKLQDKRDQYSSIRPALQAPLGVRSDKNVSGFLVRK
jgi:hypothetical protein